MKELSEEEQAWLDSLEECDREKMRDAYAGVVTKHPRMVVSYDQFVHICAKVAVKMHKKLDKKEARAFERLEKRGWKGLKDE